MPLFMKSDKYLFIADLQAVLEFAVLAVHLKKYVSRLSRAMSVLKLFVADLQALLKINFKPNRRN